MVNRIEIAPPDVTERKAAEEGLRQREQDYLVLLESTSEGIVVVDAETLKVVFGNRHAAKMFGVDPMADDPRLVNILDLVHPDDKGIVINGFAEDLLQQERRQRYEVRARTRDGREIWVSALGTRIEFQGRDAALLSMTDITERKRAEEELTEYRQHLEELVEERTAKLTKANEQLQQEVIERKKAEEALRESEEHYSALVGNLTDAVFLFEGGVIRWCNDRVEEICGYPKEELLGRHASFFYPSDISPREYARAVSAAIKEQGLFRGTSRFLRKDGSFVDIEYSLSQIPDKHPVEVIAVARDITERKQMEEALRAKEKYFQSLIENSMDGVTVLDADGIIRYASPSLGTLLGLKLEEEIGKSGFVEVHQDDLPKAADAFARLVHNPGAVVHEEVRVWHTDGSLRTIEVAGRNLLDDPAVAGIVNNFHDITDRVKAEEKLERLYEKEKKLRQQLEEEIKRRAEFARALAHELKTPLTPVVMSSQILTSELKDETLLRVARNISRGAANLNSRIDELLDLARGDIGMLHLKPEQVDVLQLFREVVEDVCPVASSRAQSLALRLPPSLPPSAPLVWCDRVRLRQIVLNLLNNAFKFTPEGGKITLRARQEDGNLVVEVKDTGPGIAEEEQQRIFDPYHRLESDRERLSGLGLGLALCKRLVELHKGRIWVKSHAGRGSTFGFSLPLEGPQPVASTNGQALTNES